MSGSEGKDKAGQTFATILVGVPPLLVLGAGAIFGAWIYLARTGWGP
ncbi:MAG: hypothetical protein OER86_14495 [Phycisphaerae bacterium]|nr:hypothetical protein [Phycisphaerae bacterium]